MKRMTPYQKIMRAAKRGTGARLSASEAWFLSRDDAIATRAGLDDEEKAFLLSMKQGEPDWDVLGIDHLARLPGLQWKLMNIRKMDTKKRTAALETLKRVLDV